MRTFLITIIAGFLLLSCKGRSGSNGEHLPPKLMQQVLLDINVAESYAITKKDSLHKPGTKNYDSLSVYYKDIFAHHKITPEQFTQSLNWYKDHPDEMDSLYTNMVPIITQWQSVPPAATKTPNN